MLTFPELGVGTTELIASVAGLLPTVEPVNVELADIVIDVGLLTDTIVVGAAVNVIETVPLAVALRDKVIELELLMD